jgi:Ca2+-binding EF-hand superfamily protein
MKKLCACLLFFSILILGTPAGAEEKKGHPCFRQIDADRDGAVTFEEFEAFYGKDKEKFNGIDLDKNGKLSHDEYHKSLGHGASEADE